MEKTKNAKLNILIVDDSKINRTLLKNMLEDEFAILEAADGMEAINVLNNYQDDVALILLDIIMPRLNGFEVLEVMNERHWIDEIPVMIISGADSFQFVRKFHLIFFCPVRKNLILPEIRGRKVHRIQALPDFQEHI